MRQESEIRAELQRLRALQSPTRPQELIVQAQVEALEWVLASGLGSLEE
jgi:hypothetical protein